MNAIAAQELMSRSHIRRGIDYGFDPTEAALITSEFPSVRIVFDIERWRMQVWNIGEYGSAPYLLYPSLNHHQQYKLIDLLRAGKYEVANYRNGQYAQRIRDNLAAERATEVDAAVDAIDPHKIGTLALQACGGRSKPVSMLGAP